eukprot:m.215777 g.215777  ORF g.215777 m.215777 type:complete len:717 (-) comp33192_c6_seq8:1178-3328(-)
MSRKGVRLWNSDDEYDAEEDDWQEDRVEPEEEDVDACTSSSRESTTGMHVPASHTIDVNVNEKKKVSNTPNFDNSNVNRDETNVSVSLDEYLLSTRAAKVDMTVSLSSSTPFRLAEGKEANVASQLLPPELWYRIFRILCQSRVSVVEILYIGRTCQDFRQLVFHGHGAWSNETRGFGFDNYLLEPSSLYTIVMKQHDNPIPKSQPDQGNSVELQAVTFWLDQLLRTTRRRNRYYHVRHFQNNVPTSITKSKLGNCFIITGDDVFVQDSLDLSLNIKREEGSDDTCWEMRDIFSTAIADGPSPTVFVMGATCRLTSSSYIQALTVKSSGSTDGSREYRVHEPLALDWEPGEMHVCSTKSRLYVSAKPTGGLVESRSQFCAFDTKTMKKVFDLDTKKAITCFNVVGHKIILGTKNSVLTYDERKPTESARKMKAHAPVIAVKFFPGKGLLTVHNDGVWWCGRGATGGCVHFAPRKDIEAAIIDEHHLYLSRKTASRTVFELRTVKNASNSEAVTVVLSEKNTALPQHLQDLKTSKPTLSATKISGLRVARSTWWQHDEKNNSFAVYDRFSDERVSPLFTTVDLLDSVEGGYFDEATYRVYALTRIHPAGGSVGPCTNLMCFPLLESIKQLQASNFSCFGASPKSHCSYCHPTNVQGHTTSSTYDDSDNDSAFETDDSRNNGQDKISKVMHLLARGTRSKNFKSLDKSTQKEIRKRAK